MVNADVVHVEVIFIADDQTCFHQHLCLAADSTVEQVLEASGLFQRHPEAVNYTVGIFSKQTSLTAFVKNGDRIEVYRPLRCDPKIQRRERAKKKVA